MSKDIIRRSTYIRELPSHIRRSFKKPIKSVKEYLQSRKDGKFYVKKAKIKDTFIDPQISPGALPIERQKMSVKNRRIGMDELRKVYDGKPPKDIADAFSKDLSYQKLKLIGPAVYGGGITAGGVAMYKKKKRKSKGLKKVASEHSDEYMLSKVLEQTALQAMELKTKIEQGTRLASWAEYKVYKAGDAIKSAHSSTYRLSNCVTGNMPMRMAMQKVAERLKGL